MKTLAPGGRLSEFQAQSRRAPNFWPGNIRYPIKFPKSFMDELLTHFPEGEVAVGGSFDAPGRGSLGDDARQHSNAVPHLARDGWAARGLSRRLNAAGGSRRTRHDYATLLPNVQHICCILNS